MSLADHVETLPQAKRAELLCEFRSALSAKMACWDAVSAMERILGSDLGEKFDEALADACATLDDADGVTDADLLAALNDSEYEGTPPSYSFMQAPDAPGE